MVLTNKWRINSIIFSKYKDTIKSTQRYEPQKSHWVIQPSHSEGLPPYRSQDIHASHSGGLPPYRSQDIHASYSQEFQHQTSQHINPRQSQRFGQQSSQVVDIHPSQSEEFPKQTSQVLRQKSRKPTMLIFFSFNTHFNWKAEKKTQICAPS